LSIGLPFQNRFHINFELLESYLERGVGHFERVRREIADGTAFREMILEEILFQLSLPSLLLFQECGPVAVEADAAALVFEKFRAQVLCGDVVVGNQRQQLVYRIQA
jgi:hypothetical protein